MVVDLENELRKCREQLAAAERENEQLKRTVVADAAVSNMRQERYEKAEVALAAAQEELKKYKIADDLSQKRIEELEADAYKDEAALLSAQKEIERKDVALRKVNHLQHSLAIEQAGSGNMRIEYWTREIEGVVCAALAQNQTKETK